jgi:hypothetical protein
MKLYEDRLYFFTPFSWRRSSFAITAKQNLFLHLNNKKWRKKWRKKQRKQKDLSVLKMGDLPAYSCYAEMTSRPTMKNRHRSYHMSHHILVDWSSSLPLCYLLLRIRRMKKRDDRFHNRKKTKQTQQIKLIKQQDNTIYVWNINKLMQDIFSPGFVLSRQSKREKDSPN